ncbi:hypothetical protein LP420_16045 [Massilia sp. B-10]|nr:hypothetical protein LP420_16045 [Massilia sp. B-10]
MHPPVWPGAPAAGGHLRRRSRHRHGVTGALRRAQPERGRPDPAGNRHPGGQGRHRGPGGTASAILYAGPARRYERNLAS